MQDQSQTSNNVEKRGNGKKFEFTSFTSNTTNGSNRTNCTMLSTGSYQQPVSRHSNVNSETSNKNTTDLKKTDKLDLHLENGKATKERSQETNIIQTEVPSARIETGVNDYSLEPRLVVIKIGNSYRGIYLPFPF